MSAALIFVLAIVLIAFFAGTTRGGVKEGAAQVLKMLRYGAIFAALVVVAVIVSLLVSAFNQ
jgi:hypothetical protein